ncbi:tetratricopeptide repeat protein [Actinocorallia herbida]|uniref:Tetratricopeptide repeat protein n=1 Tax=Actinocorallia herbida TaxID=58109 RepID=A0A3N1CNY5_9ACTN|nr:tetratricopeptide repeat protein [Actinocorallia herbida]ROO82983.1 tetratricopeptide repeat protein [Actinocorallia herbida]
MQLAFDDPAILRAELARGLGDLAAALARAGDRPREIIARRVLAGLLPPGLPLAGVLRDLAAAHAASGDLEEAVAVRGRAFRLLESLAAEDERRWPDVLADAEAYTELLAEADRPTDAAVVSRRVVRGLALLLADGREGLRPEYARSLRLWGDSLAGDDEYVEAADAVRQSAEQFRLLGDRYSAALSLARVSSLQALLDDLEGALDSSREALAEVQALAREDVDGDWRMTRCSAVQTVASRLSALDRPDEALEALLSVRDGFAGLYAEDTGIHHWYADYLEDLATACSAVGAESEALKTAEDLVHVYRDRNAGMPAEPDRELAYSLLRLVGLRRDAGDVGQAIQAAREAAGLFRDLGEDARYVHCLCLVSDHLALLDDSDDGLGAAEEAVEAARREGGRPLGEALVTLGNRLDDRDRADESFAAAAEAVDVLTELGGHADLLAPALHDRGSRARSLGMHDLALQSALDATALYQELYEEDLAHGLLLADALCLLGQIREAEESFEHAVTALDRAVSLLERISRPDLPRAATALAVALHDASRYHERIGGLEKALGLMRRAITLYGELSRDEPDRFRPLLAGAWRSLGIYLAKLGQTEEAFTAALFDVDLHREIGDLPNLAQALRALGLHHEALGRPAEAVGATRESLEVYEELHLLRGGAYFAAQTAVVSSRLAALVGAPEAVALRERAVALFTEAGEAVEAAAELMRLLRERSLAGLDVEPTIAAISAQGSAVGTVRHLNAVADELLDDGALEAADLLHTRAWALWEIHLLEVPDAPRVTAVALLETDAALRARLGLPDAAATAQAEALELLEPLLDAYAAEHLNALARVLSKLAGYLADADRPGDALPHQTRAAGLHEDIATRSPAHRPALATALSVLADLQSRTGAPEAARTRARAEALTAALTDE